LAKVTIEKGILFDLKLPSKELEKRIENVEKNKNTQTYSNSKELFDELGI